MKPVLLINASTVKISGGLYVSLDIIEALINSEKYELVLLCPDIAAFRSFRNRITVHRVPSLLFHYAFRIFLDHCWMKLMIRKYNPDCIVSLSNLPACTNKFQVFFHDNAFMTVHRLTGYDLSLKALLQHFARRIVFKNRLRFIDRVIVQTELEKQNFTNRYPLHPPVLTREPMIPLHLKESGTALPISSGKEKNFIRIGCLSRYFDHKNLNILYAAASLSIKQSLPFQFVLTINTKEGGKARKLIQSIRNHNCENRIITVGNIPRNKISAFVSEMDGIILPSLLESFSLNCLEAWFLKKPMFISDRDFAQEVCGNAALYFNPDSPQEILNVLIKYFIRREGTEIVEAGTEKLKSFPRREMFLEGIFD